MKEARPDVPIILDYALTSRPRYDPDKPHQRLQEILRQRADIYASHLTQFIGLKDFLIQIPRSVEEDSSEPSWVNGYQPALDAAVLYGFLAVTNPKTYLEIGSGYSTKFVRRAIKDHQLRTKVLSIDPNPRAEIDVLCDSVIRSPLQNCDLSVFDQLGEGDILFVDGSHRCLMNSDVTVFFLEIFPNLRPGVIVGIHDVFLPYDYPHQWSERFYSEQYLLACHLLSPSPRFEVLLPNFFVSRDLQLSPILSSLWTAEPLRGIKGEGSAFWIRMK